MPVLYNNKVLTLAFVNGSHYVRFPPIALAQFEKRPSSTVLLLTLPTSVTTP